MGRNFLMASSPLVATTRLPNERRFYTGMATTMLVVVVVGLGRSFYLHSMFPEWHRPAESIFYVHGTVFTVCILLLIGQVSLVMTGRRDVHRKIGVAGAVVAALMVVLGTVAALVAA